MGDHADDAVEHALGLDDQGDDDRSGSPLVSSPTAPRGAPIDVDRPKRKRGRPRKDDAPPARRTPGRAPEYRLSVLDKDTDDRNQVGAGWANEDGSISIRLNVGVILDWHDNRRVELRLFPRD